MAFEAREFMTHFRDVPFWGSNPPSKASSKPSYVEMQNKATAYVEPWFHKRLLLVSIQEILDKPAFQRNPKGFLRTWTVERNSSVRSCNDELVYEFFRENYKL